MNIVKLENEKATFTMSLGEIGLLEDVLWTACEKMIKDENADQQDVDTACQLQAGFYGAFARLVDGPYRWCGPCHKVLNGKCPGQGFSCMSIT
jgi:hypothetical protein